jgi:hypothetical protein
MLVLSTSNTDPKEYKHELWGTSMDEYETPERFMVRVSSWDPFIIKTPLRVVGEDGKMPSFNSASTFVWKPETQSFVRK